MSARTVRDDSLRFARRIHPLRTLGMGLGGLCIGAVLHEQGAGIALWVALALSCMVWPQLALLHALRSGNPHRAEVRNLLVDSALGGIWIALMQFNLMPSVLFATMLMVDKLSVGIPRLWQHATTGLVAACLVTAAANGFAFAPASSMTVVIASMPMLVVYPLAISIVSYRLVRKVRHQNRLLDELSRTDALTGLSGRRHWQATAEGELVRHHRGGHPACLLLIDIDYFKSINDRFGHAVGDEVIRAVATVIRDSIRSIDNAGRFGGDEFGIVLVDSHYKQAQHVAERIRRGVEAIGLPDTPALACSVSIGIAEAVDGHGVLRDWLAEADSALYRAKRAGRNRTAGPVVLPIGNRAGLLGAGHPAPASARDDS